MKKLFSLIKRELRLFISNKIMISLYIGGPVIYGLLFGAIYTKGKVTGLPVIIVNKDKSPMSTMLTDMLKENETLMIKYVAYENMDIQEKFITEGIQGAVVIPSQFGADIIQGRYPELNTYINNGDILSSGYANRAINLVVATLNAIVSAKTGKPQEAIHLNTFRLFNPSSNYLTFIWPSYLAILLQSVILVVIAMSFVSETENNTYSRLIKLQSNPMAIIFGKLSLYWILGLVILFIYGLYFSLFKLRLPVHIEASLLISVLFIAALSFQGMMAGLIFKSQLKAIQFLTILIMPAYISSGFSWPFDHNALPAQIYGILFPFMPFVNGFRVLLIEHGTLSDISEYILLQVMQLVLYFSIACFLLNHKMKLWRKSLRLQTI